MGGVAERLKAPVLKTGKGFASSWVRIPSPPLYETSFLRKGRFSYESDTIRIEGVQTMRDIFAVLVGWIVGMAANMAFVFLSVALYPMPEGITFNNKEGFAAYIETLPLTAFLIVLVAHVSQAFFGGLAAAKISKKRRVTVAMIIGVLSLIGGYINMQSIPLPTWMWIEMPLYLVFAWLAAYLVIAYDRKKNRVQHI